MRVLEIFPGLAKTVVNEHPAVALVAAWFQIAMLERFFREQDAIRKAKNPSSPPTAVDDFLSTCEGLGKGFFGQLNLDDADAIFMDPITDISFTEAMEYFRNKKTRE